VRHIPPIASTPSTPPSQGRNEQRPDTAFRQVRLTRPLLAEGMVFVLESAARGSAKEQGERPRGPGTHPALLASLVHRDGCPVKWVEAVRGGARCTDCRAADYLTHRRVAISRHDVSSGASASEL
jgi:hypothetical protein